MKQDRIAKLYAGLTNKELAALTFRHLTNANAPEVARVAAAVPRKHYRGPDAEFQQLLDGTFNMAAYWAIQYWKMQTHRLAAHCTVLMAQREESREAVAAALDEYQRCESRLLALDGALLAICKTHGIDPDAVRKLAGAEACDPIFTGLLPDTEFQTVSQANLTLVLGEKGCDREH